MFNSEIKSIIHLVEIFKTTQDCIDHLEQLRWNCNPESPFKKDSKVYKCKNNLYRCKDTGKYFNVKSGTLFENSKISLQKWFIAIWLTSSYKKGVSSLQLSREIKVTQKTAWFMLQRIRNCFGFDNNAEVDGVIEVDETYVGGYIPGLNRRKRTTRRIL